MVAQEPVAGSFSHFAYKYWGDFPGFLSGWNYWMLYVLVSMAELTAVGTYVHFWWPGVPTWLSALVCFAIIKVAAVIGMIIFGGYLLISGHGGPQATVANLRSHGGFFPHGFHGLFMMLAVIMFSFGGLELPRIHGADSRDSGADAGLVGLGVAGAGMARADVGRLRDQAAPRGCARWHGAASR
jgi:aromatic amino acid transport protein AroP